MPKRPVDDDSLYLIATYLQRPEAECEIHVELSRKRKKMFEDKYMQITQGLYIDGDSSYFELRDRVDKYGLELRVYFKRYPPEPSLIKVMYTDQDKLKKGFYHVNHNALVMQLFECGFTIGPNADNQQRIEEFMRRKFPLDPYPY